MSKQGRLDDGMGSAPYDVRIDVTADLLILKSTRPKLELRWNYRNMRALQKPKLAVPGAFTTTKTPNARLLIENQKLWARIDKRLPGYKPQEHSRLLRIGIALALLFMITLALTLWQYPALFKGLLP